jgi:hypothetical protein
MIPSPQPSTKPGKSTYPRQRALHERLLTSTELIPKEGSPPGFDIA